MPSKRKTSTKKAVVTHRPASIKNAPTPSKRTSSYSLDTLLNNVRTNFTLYLVAILLFVAGFAGGSLWQENRMLKEGYVGGANNPTTALPNVPEGPTKEQLNQMPKVTDEDWQQGAKKAKVTLVEYSDLECPFCKQFHPTVETMLEEYPDDVAWVWRHYPLPFHANAQKAAEAAECAGKLGGQNAFWDFVDAYYAKTDSSGTGVAIEDMPALAGTVGVNVAQVKTCLDNGEMAEKVQAQMDAGATVGVSGTPGTLVVTKDGVQELIPGALPAESVKQIIEQYL